MDLNQASREALLEIIAELRQRVESLEARLSGGGPGVRMPGHEPAAKRKKPAAEEKKPRKKRQHGFARPRMEPTWAGGPRPGVLPRMPYRSHRGMGPADPGGHRHSGSPGGSHGARIHSPDLSFVPETAAAPGPSERSGRGSATLRSQSGGLDRDPAGRGAAACKDHPMVSANVPSVETERWGHRPGGPSEPAPYSIRGCPAGRTGSGRGAGAHPLQPGGPRR